MFSFNHTTVLLNETIDILNINPNGVYVDCTLGGGGHSKLILTNLTQGKLISIDKDINAINNFKNINSNYENQSILINDSYANIKNIISNHNISSVNGIIFDLGVSSPQIDTAQRGFSYHNDGILDMRMDISQTKDAKHVINTYSHKQLCNIFRLYGECKYVKKVADLICDTRQTQEINTTLQLVDLIKQGLPKKELTKNKHPAKQFFQAIRIEVNNELDDLKKALNDAIEMLAINGRVAVITFHSLEDKIVKDIFKKYTTSKLPAYLPISESDVKYKIVCKPIKPSLTEIHNNKRARSAKLRSIERIAN